MILCVTEQRMGFAGTVTILEINSDIEAEREWVFIFYFSNKIYASLSSRNTKEDIKVTGKGKLGEKGTVTTEDKEAEDWTRGYIDRLALAEEFTNHLPSLSFLALLFIGNVISFRTRIRRAVRRHLPRRLQSHRRRLELP